MGKFWIGLLVGLAAGTLLVFFLFGGVPRASQKPGEPVRPPDAGGNPPGTAQIVLRAAFFNEILQTLFRDMKPPSFPLGRSLGPGETDPNAVKYGLEQGGTCDGRINVLPEGSGVKTGVRFDGNKLAAPIAFSGSYNSPVGCFQFTGWAQANLELRFDAEKQIVFGSINVETVNLDGLSPLVSGFVTPLVQTTLNNRVNPIQILQTGQIGVDLPIAASEGKLRANVKDIRADVRDEALNLYAIYEFSGTQGVK